MRKLKLIENWRDAKKWFSVQAMLWASVIQLVWLELPADLKASISPKLVSSITVALLIFGIVGRVVSQEKTNAKA